MCQSFLKFLITSLEVSHLKSEVHRLELCNMEMEQHHESLLGRLARLYEEKSKLENILQEYDVNSWSKELLTTQSPIRKNKDIYNFEEKVNFQDSRSIDTSHKIESNVKDISFINHLCSCDINPTNKMNILREEKENSNQIIGDSLEMNEIMQQKSHIEQAKLSDDRESRAPFKMSAPFATDFTREELLTFDAKDKQLTQAISEKKLLVEEHAK